MSSPSGFAPFESVIANTPLNTATHLERREARVAVRRSARYVAPSAHRTYYARMASATTTPARDLALLHIALAYGTDHDLNDDEVRTRVGRSIIEDRHKWVEEGLDR